MKIILEKSKCIGCGSCVAVCGKFFELGIDGLATIKEGVDKDGSVEIEVSVADCASEATEICPVQAIKIE